LSAKEAREAERERIKGIREAEKASKIAEKEARKRAENTVDDDIFVRPTTRRDPTAQDEEGSRPMPVRITSTRQPEATPP
jgi:hypothetical protein